MSEEISLEARAGPAAEHVQVWDYWAAAEPGPGAISATRRLWAWSSNDLAGQNFQSFEDAMHDCRSRVGQGLLKEDAEPSSGAGAQASGRDPDLPTETPAPGDHIDGLDGGS